MFARVTRYEGGSPGEIDENLKRKKHVLPTEPGQTEGMHGAIFLADRGSGAVVVVSLWADEDALKASEDEAARLRDEVIAEGETATVERFEVAQFAVSQEQA
jgi:hypothetical protein